MSFHEIKNIVMSKFITKSCIVGVIAIASLTSAIKSSADAFTKKDDILQFTAGRWGAMSFTVNNKIYAGGGYIGSASMNDWQEFDPATGKWTVKKNMPGTNADRAAGITFVINGKAYLGLGAEHYLSFSLNQTELTDLWEYDPTNDSWTQKASLPDTGRDASAVFVINNKAYVVGGELNSLGGKTSDVWEYDPATNKWTSKGAYPEGGLQYGMGFSLNGKGYVTGGSATATTQSTYEFDGSKWTAKASFIDTGRMGAVCFVAGGKAFIGLGGGFSSYPTSFYTYDATTDKWGFLTGKWPTVGRMYGRAEVVNNKAYMGFGWRLDGSNQTFYRDWWEADPVALLGVKDAASTANFDMHVYPNPSNGLLHLDVTGNVQKEAVCNVYDLTGRRVYTGHASTSNVIDLRSQPAGRYIVEVVNDGNKITTNINIE